MSQARMYAELGSVFGSRYVEVLSCEQPKSRCLELAAAFGVGNWTGSSARNPNIDERSAPALGATGQIDTAEARQRGAQLGEKAAIATEKVRDTARAATITTKIKAKMARDDSVRARAIDVSTDGSTVTLKGTVRSVAEHDRAMALSRGSPRAERTRGAAGEPEAVRLSANSNEGNGFELPLWAGPNRRADSVRGTDA